jgi:hypothetical protein
MRTAPFLFSGSWPRRLGAQPSRYSNFFSGSPTVLILETRARLRVEISFALLSSDHK